MDAVADCFDCDGRRRLSGKTDFINFEMSEIKVLFHGEQSFYERGLFLDTGCMAEKWGEEYDMEFDQTWSDRLEFATQISRADRYPSQ